MLKDFKKFKKQLKDIKEKISNIRITNNVKLILVLIFFVVSIIFIANNRLRYDNKLEEKVANKIKIIELLNKVEDSYSLDVTKKYKDKSESLNYQKADKLELYSGDNLAHDGFIIYNNQVFYSDSQEEKLHKDNKTYDFLNDNYLDMNLYKKVVNYCEFEYVSSTKSTCNIKLSDFIKAYNDLYDTSFKVTNDSNLTFDTTYSSSRFSGINIDYTKINEIIDPTKESVTYNIKINKFDSTLIDTIYEYFKDDLNK